MPDLWRRWQMRCRGSGRVASQWARLPQRWRTTQVSADRSSVDGGGISNTISLDIVPGSGCAAGSSSHSHQAPPSMLPQTHSSGGAIGGGVDGGSSAGIASQVSLLGSSCYHYQMPPPLSLASMALDPIPMLGGRVDGSASSTFLSLLDTGRASVVGLTPLSSSVDLPAAGVIVVILLSAAFDGEHGHRRLRVDPGGKSM